MFRAIVGSVPVAVRLFSAVTFSIFLLSTSGVVRADSAQMIDDHTQRALKWMYGSSRHTAKQLKRAAGVLVFGDVIKMGFGLGGEFGEGALIVDGEIVGYYAISGKEYGVDAGAAYKAKAIVFRTEKALESFRKTNSWKVGSNAVVPTVASVEKKDRVLRSSEPIIGLIFTDSGLVSNLSLNGNKITRIAR